MQCNSLSVSRRNIYHTLYSISPSFTTHEWTSGIAPEKWWRMACLSHFSELSRQSDNARKHGDWRESDIEMAGLHSCTFTSRHGLWPMTGRKVDRGEELSKWSSKVTIDRPRFTDSWEILLIVFNYGMVFSLWKNSKSIEEWDCQIYERFFKTATKSEQWLRLPQFPLHTLKTSR